MPTHIIYSVWRNEVTDKIIKNNNKKSMIQLPMDMPGVLTIPS